MSTPALALRASVPKIRQTAVSATPAAKKANEPEVVQFFRGTGTDSECRSLEEMLKWDDQLMEVCHNYIQWLLPTDEPSRFNSDAPVLDEVSKAMFRGDEALRNNLRRGLKHFLAFLGLTICGEDADWNGSSSGAESAVKIVRVEKFGECSRRLRRWSGPNNHNWKRISRTLRCLGLVGLDKEQRALHRCLEELVADYPTLIDADTLTLWRFRAGVGKDASRNEPDSASEEASTQAEQEGNAPSTSEACSTRSRSKNSLSSSGCSYPLNPCAGKKNATGDSTVGNAKGNGKGTGKGSAKGKGSGKGKAKGKGSGKGKARGPYGRHA